jgi:lipid-A-disaccharide synthase-like uncharacterized protein
MSSSATGGDEIMTAESQVRKIIWPVDESHAGGVLQFAATAMVAAALLAAFAWLRFAGIHDSQAMEQCSLARNLAEGRGFSATCVRPAEIAMLQRSGRRVDLRHFPEIRQAPAYPVALSGAMRLVHPRNEAGPRSGVFRPETTLVIPFGILCTLASATLIYLSGRKWFSHEAGQIAAVAFLIWEPVLAASISGGSLPFLAFTFSLGVWLAVTAANACNQQRSAALWAPAFAAAGCLAGVTFLGAYVLWPMIPGMAFLGACLCDRRRWIAFGLTLAAGGLAIAPWLHRNLAVAGHPLGSAPWALLNGTSLFKPGGWDAAIAALPARSEMVAAVQVKFLANIPIRIESVFSLIGGTVLAAFFLVAFFIRFDGESANRARWPVLAMLAAVLIASACGDERSAAHIRVFLPLVAVFGTASVFVIAEHRDYLLPATRSLLVWSAVGLNALPLVLKVWGTAPVSPYPPCFSPLNIYAAKQLQESEVLCTDIPWATAWYANRLSILTPDSVNTLEELRATFPSIQGLYLTTETRRVASGIPGKSAEESDWSRLLAGWAPAGFPMTNGFCLPPGTRDQVLLFDGSRQAGTDAVSP